jgi:hypothetical protein
MPKAGQPALGKARSMDACSLPMPGMFCSQFVGLNAQKSNLECKMREMGFFPYSLLPLRHSAEVRGFQSCILVFGSSVT